ncbi:hypothetical protein M0812_22932 [Anaeramoeba flamelloides]|uniref:Monopolin complex subunit Csm1/Pcs1 C-terminal domain-containing protein n=1 Tax=Anaeramoeba flamelloides TaxID=1746091 RepID=A0AAV7YPR6_9EUKA|nr:hypothetical protein M0812_22932 [Anaeramoeba flamelloides]
MNSTLKNRQVTGYSQFCEGLDFEVLSPNNRKRSHTEMFTLKKQGKSLPKGSKKKEESKENSHPTKKNQQNTNVSQKQKKNKQNKKKTRKSLFISDITNSQYDLKHRVEERYLKKLESKENKNSTIKLGSNENKQKRDYKNQKIRNSTFLVKTKKANKDESKNKKKSKTKGESESESETETETESEMTISNTDKEDSEDYRLFELSSEFDIFQNENSDSSRVESLKFAKQPKSKNDSGEEGDEEDEGDFLNIIDNNENEIESKVEEQDQEKGEEEEIGIEKEKKKKQEKKKEEENFESNQIFKTEQIFEEFKKSIIQQQQIQQIELDKLEKENKKLKTLLKKEEVKNKQKNQINSQNVLLEKTNKKLNLKLKKIEREFNELTERLNKDPNKQKNVKKNYKTGNINLELNSQIQGLNNKIKELNTDKKKLQQQITNLIEKEKLQMTKKTAQALETEFRINSFQQMLSGVKVQSISKNTFLCQCAQKNTKRKIVFEVKTDQDDLDNDILYEPTDICLGESKKPFPEFLTIPIFFSPNHCPLFLSKLIKNVFEENEKEDENDHVSQKEKK